MNKIESALRKSLARFQMIDKGQAVFVRDAIDDCKSALSDIDKCAPVYLIVSGADEIVVTKEKYDSWTSAKRISYTSPISKEWVSKDLLETDDGKWDATLMALWRRLYRHKNGADFWYEAEISDDEMYIFRAHFATALLASPIKQLNTEKG